MNPLDQLKQYTTIVADTADIEYIVRSHPTNVTTNPSLILKTVIQPKYYYLVNEAILYAKKQGGSTTTQLINANHKILVNIVLQILNNISGKISTEIDSRFSFDKKMCINQAHKLITMYQEEGISKSRILIKLASTWEAIRAAEQLEMEGIHCNMTLLFSLAQARACADAGVFMISPFVGRISDWYSLKNKCLNNNSKVIRDPGLQFIRNIYSYYKKYNYKTIIMGASFRSIEQIIALAGCDSLTISPELIEQIKNTALPITRKLFPIVTESYATKPARSSEATFRWDHNQDAMAVEKLSQGIRDFYIDQQKLDQMILNFL
ncbi:MAG: transaldolase [Candidatus Dasytiphilus stammeri]